MLRRLFSWLFILISRTRLFFYRIGLFKSSKVPARVISIGNISMGGSGKTPMVLALANDAIAKGHTTAVIEKGYKSGLKSGQVVLSQKGQDDSPDVKLVGDEAKMVWDSIPTGVRLCVSKNKTQGAILCMEKWKDTKIIIVDDGFQHLTLNRDVDVVLIDATTGFNDKVFPHGALREPYSSLKRASVVVFTKSDDLKQKELDELSDKAKSYNSDIKVFFAKTKFYCSEPLDGKKVLPVSAVYNGAHFRSKLKGVNAVFEKYMEYSDHRKFTHKDLSDILSFKKNIGAEVIAVTKKDWSKLESLMPNNEAVALCWYEHVIEDKEGFLKCCIGS